MDQASNTPSSTPLALQLTLDSSRLLRDKQSSSPVSSTGGANSPQPGLGSAGNASTSLYGLDGWDMTSPNPPASMHAFIPHSGPSSASVDMFLTNEFHASCLLNSPATVSLDLSNSRSPYHHHHQLSLPIKPHDSPLMTAGATPNSASETGMYSSGGAPQPFLEYLGAPGDDFGGFNGGYDEKDAWQAYKTANHLVSNGSGEFDPHHLSDDGLPHVVLPSSNEWGTNSPHSHQMQMYAVAAASNDMMPTSPPPPEYKLSTSRTLSSRALSSARFNCPRDGCNKVFKRMEHLSRHLRMHTGERPFNCPEAGCGRSFSRSDNLAAHRRTHIKSAAKMAAAGQWKAVAMVGKQQQQLLTPISTQHTTPFMDYNGFN